MREKRREYARVDAAFKGRDEGHLRYGKKEEDG